MIENMYYRNKDVKIKAAAAVLKRLYDSGNFIIDPMDAARQMLEAAAHATDPQRFFGYMKDGAKVAIEFVDKGDIIPGYDENKNRYEAVTSWWRLTFFEPRGSEGQHIMEDYIQVDRLKAETADDIDVCRWDHDMRALNSMGVDTDCGFESVGAEEFRKAVLPIHRVDRERWEKTKK